LGKNASRALSARLTFAARRTFDVVPAKAGIHVYLSSRKDVDARPSPGMTDNDVNIDAHRNPVGIDSVGKQEDADGVLPDRVHRDETHKERT
jgi:hypothetical protein